MNTTRIAHVISSPAGVGGAERVVAALARGGQDRGWEQIVLNPFAQPPLDELEDLFSHGIYRAFHCERLLQVPGSRRWLRNSLRGFGPSFTHVHLFHAMTMAASIGGDATGMRILTHHHGDFFSAHGDRFNALLDRWAGRRFDRVVAVSESVRTFLIESYGYSPQKIITITNGWEGKPNSRVSNGRPPTIICAANFRPEKGHSVLVDAIQMVVHQIPEVRVLLLGDGPLRGDLEHRVRDLGLERHFVFEGWVPEVWPYLAAADLFVFPSLSEPLGIAVMEAMAAGLPVVASAIGGIPEMVESGVTGELVPPGDAGALSGALIRLLRSSVLRAQMGVAAERTAENLRMGRTVERYFALYDALQENR